MDAIGKAIASLGLASSLFHASQTKFGHLYDTKMVDLIIWTTYREAFQKIKALSKTTIKHFNEVKENEWVVKPSIPILYFGDLNHYFNSKLKIITVALNPSNKEFPLEGKPRFSFCPAELSESDADKYMQTLSQYFERGRLPKIISIYIYIAKQTERAQRHVRQVN